MVSDKSMLASMGVKKAFFFTKHRQAVNKFEDGTSGNVNISGIWISHNGSRSLWTAMNERNKLFNVDMANRPTLDTVRREKHT